MTLRERALRCLARREYARAELARILLPHADNEQEVEALLNDLSERGLLSETRYVEMRLNVRAGRFGDARLFQELRMQGVPEELIRESIASGTEEIERAREVWRRKYGTREAPADVAEYARMKRFMISRGFSAETIRRVMRENFEKD